MNNKYKIIEIIGEGAYGIVYKCLNTETNEIVAIKKFIDEYEKLPKNIINREIFILQRSKNENIVKLLEVFLNNGYLYLVFEYVEKNLIQLIEEYPKGLNQELIRTFIYQICKAISYLHKRNIIHRDIKPENLLIKDNSIIKLCDFGFARKMKINEKTNKFEKMTDYMATRWYRAPEIILGQGNYGPEIDFWSIGCIMGEMADGNALFPGENQINQLEYIIKLLGNLPEELIEYYNNNPNFNINKLITVDNPETLEKRYENILSPDAIDFMKGLLELNPKKRLNYETVFNHKYFECFKNINNDKNDNDLSFTLNLDESKIIEIHNYHNDDSKEKNSPKINTTKKNNDSFLNDTNESTLSKKKIKESENENNDLVKSCQVRKKKRYRSDMVDFGNLYLLSQKEKSAEKEKAEGKNNINIKNDFNSRVNELKLSFKSLNHKKSFLIVKNKNSSYVSNKTINLEKGPNLTPKLLPDIRLSEKRNRNRKMKKINYVTLTNSLKTKSKKKSLFAPIAQNSINKYLLTKDKNEPNISKKYRHSIDNSIIINKNNNIKLKKNDIKIRINNNNFDRGFINLYEKAFNDIIFTPKDKKEKKSSSIHKNNDKKNLLKIITSRKSLDNNLKKDIVHLPPIFKYKYDVLNINKNRIACKDNLDKKFVNNRYKIQIF